MGTGRTILAALGQVGRKPEFQLITTLEKSSIGLVSVKKRALTKQAYPHLKQIATNRETLDRRIKQLNLAINVGAIASVAEDHLVFEYLEGMSCEQKLFAAVVSHDEQTVLETIREVFKFIDGFATKNSDNYPEFAKDVSVGYSSNDKFISPAILDCNFDNFIDGDILTLIDYEWVFEGRLPADFIKTRALCFFFERYSDAFRALPRDDKPFIEILTYTKLLVPEYVYKKYGKLLDEPSINYFRSLEGLFQGYVSNSNVSAQPAVSYQTRQLTYPEPTLPDSFLQGQYQLNDTQAELNKSLAHSNSLQERLDLILGSRTWKFASKIQRLVSFIRR